MLSAAHRNRRLRLEVLEPRRLLAGNLTAQVVAGVLTVLGDALDNGLSVTRGPDSEYVLTGEAANGRPTSINGQPSVTFSHAEGLSVDLRGGNNRLTLGRVMIAGNLDVFAGAGNDTIDFTTDVFVSNRLQILSGAGRDTLLIDDTFVGGNAYLRIGAGDGTTVKIEASTVAGEFSLYTGAGAATIDIAAGAVEGDPTNTLEPEFGIRAGGNARIVTGYGSENVTVQDSVFGDNLLVFTSAGDGNHVVRVSDTAVRGNAALQVRAFGDKTVALANLTVSGQFQLQTNQGHASIDIGAGAVASPTGTASEFGVRAGGNARIVTGYGNENVSLRDSLFGKDLLLFTSAGDGAHAVRMGNTIVGGSAALQVRAFDEKTIEIADSMVAGSFDLQIGPGTSAVNIAAGAVSSSIGAASVFGLVARRAAILAREGADHWIVKNTTATDGFFADLGAGDDTLDFAGNMVGRVVDLRGGSGVNTINRGVQTENSVAQWFISGFANLGP